MRITEAAGLSRYFCTHDAIIFCLRSSTHIELRRSLYITALQGHRTGHKMAKTSFINEDKVRGMLWGVALGDALGAPHEFRVVSISNYTGVLEYPYTRLSRWQGRRVGVAGQITDDTEMMICLARSIINNDSYNRNDTLAMYMEWANTAPSMGVNTRRLLQGVKTLKGYNARTRKHEDAMNYSQSNGCLMRCAPLVVRSLEDAVSDCRLTNPHEVCVESCKAYHYMTKSAMAGNSAAKIIADLMKQVASPTVKDTLISTTRNVKLNSGWVLNGLWCAAHAIRGIEKPDATFSTVMDSIIRLEGDTDTNGAIAGGLLGARLGYTKMIEDKKTSANIEVIRNADYSKGNLNRPSYYHPNQLDKMATSLYRLSLVD